MFWLNKPRSQNDQLEDVSWLQLADRNWVPRNHAELIANLQEVHDWSPVESWREHLSKVAQYYNLTMV